MFDIFNKKRVALLEKINEVQALAIKDLTQQLAAKHRKLPVEHTSLTDTIIPIYPPKPSRKGAKKNQGLLYGTPQVKGKVATVAQGRKQEKK